LSADDDKLTLICATLESQNMLLKQQYKKMKMFYNQASIIVDDEEKQELNLELRNLKQDIEQLDGYLLNKQPMKNLKNPTLNKCANNIKQLLEHRNALLDNLQNVETKFAESKQKIINCLSGDEFFSNWEYTSKNKNITSLKTLRDYKSTLEEIVTYFEQLSNFIKNEYKSLKLKIEYLIKTDKKTPIILDTPTTTIEYTSFKAKPYFEKFADSMYKHISIVSAHKTCTTCMKISTPQSYFGYKVTDRLMSEILFFGGNDLILIDPKNCCNEIERLHLKLIKKINKKYSSKSCLWYRHFLKKKYEVSAAPDDSPRGFNQIKLRFYDTYLAETISGKNISFGEFMNDPNPKQTYYKYYRQLDKEANTRNTMYDLTSFSTTLLKKHKQNIGKVASHITFMLLKQ
jgi:ribosomal protein S8